MTYHWVSSQGQTSLETGESGLIPIRGEPANSTTPSLGAETEVRR